MDPKLPFPDVTLCNMQPIPLKQLQQLQRGELHGHFRYTPYEWSRAVVSRHRQFNLTSQMGSHMNSMPTYFANLPSNLTGHLGYDSAQLIVKEFCQLRSSRGRIVDCSAAQITLVRDSRYFKCYRLSIHDQLASEVTSLQVLSFLDFRDAWRCDNCIHGNLQSAEQGLVVEVQVQGYQPMLHHARVNKLQPGTINYLVYKHRTFELLPPPLGQCHLDQPEFVRLVSGGVGGDDDDIADPAGATSLYRRDPDACPAVQLQETLAQRCGCHSSRHDQLAEHRHLPYCESLGSWHWLAGQQAPNHSGLFCMDQQVAEMPAECAKPCSFPQPEVQLLTARAFPTGFLLGLYSALNSSRGIDQAQLSKRFPILDYLSRQNWTSADGWLRRGGHNSLEYLQFRLECTDLRNSLVAFEVSVPSRGVELLREASLSDAFNLVSSIGGSLALWSGLTVVGLVEMLEFAFYCCKAVATRWRGRGGCHQVGPAVTTVAAVADGGQQQKQQQLSIRRHETASKTLPLY